MAEPLFVAAPAETLIVRPLDSLVALYHRASGITHLVASPVPEMLAALATPMTVDALLTRLAAEFELLDADRGALSGRLAELEAAGLVRRA